jgi:hypothetical protein
VEGGPIVEGACVTFDASLVVEIWFFWGTDGTGVLTEIVYGVFWAGSALLGIKIEIFGQIALDALLVCEEWLILRAFTTVLL